MKFHFLGGADEVGASCILAEIGGHRILVDCGIRMKARDGDNLPNLRQIQDQGGIEAVVLTHAHIDHSGALPVIYQMYDVPLYLTPATLSLINIMLVDALNIMQIERQMEGEIPLYSVHEVEKVIGSARPVPFDKTIELFGGDVRITFYSAGHILGAAFVLLESKGDGIAMISGDISLTDQMTITGSQIPPNLKPDIVIIESTYGGKLHASRKLEEKRLIEQSGSIIDNGGSVLFPAFAVGRAQEIILILSYAIEKGLLKKVPIIVDGLVRNICKVYSSYPAIVTPRLRKNIKKYGNPFFGHEASSVIPVWDPKTRVDYAKLRPSIIVSSSGMLAGGPSQFYATELSNDPNSFIAITGYQDEESPGRRLQEIASAGKGELQLGQLVVEPKCKIGTYSLSAHADTTQLLGVLQSVTTKRVALVHGEERARDELEKAVLRAGIKEVHKPGLGDELIVHGDRRKKVSKAYLEDQKVETLSLDNLPVLTKKLLSKDGPGRPYTIQELLVAWGYSFEAITTEKINQTRELLRLDASPFKQDGKKPFLYRVRVDSHGMVMQGKAAEAAGRWDQEKTLQKINELFPPEAGLYKKSLRPGSNILALSFHFPKAAQKKYEGLIKQIQEESKWEVMVIQSVNHEALVEASLRAIPPEWPVNKNPSIHLQEERVVVYVNINNPPLDQVEEGIKKFKDQTGFDLVISGLSGEVPPVRVSKESGETKDGAPPSPPPQAEKTQTLQPGKQSMEFNMACAEIKARFKNVEHQILKVSRKGNYVELAFISPEVGKRYQELIEKLESEIGWPIQIKPNPNQQLILETLKNIVPVSLEVVKAPSIYLNEHEVIVWVKSISDEKEIASITEKFMDQTGYKLTIKTLEVYDRDKKISFPYQIITMPIEKIIIPQRLKSIVFNPMNFEKLKRAYKTLGKTPKPVEIKKIGEDKYLLIDGLKRIRVAEELGYNTIEAFVVNDQESAVTDE